MTKRILYIEDMQACYDKTIAALGPEYDLDWRKNLPEAMQALKNIKAYNAVVLDGNLDYNDSLPDDAQSVEGLEIIREIRRRGSNIPIIFASCNGTSIPRALKEGANFVMWKKEFWNGKGKAKLEGLLG
jgi:CheY-like chemotaxis protein